MENYIFVKGARVHNLKNIDVKIPRNKLVVITGLSGSGKSSLAMDTIYAEGQRRYIESLSSYARQFLGQMEKPDVDYIEGLSPAISIDQKAVSKNPRSTVGTVTEIYDYLRVLFARIGQPTCPQCGAKIQSQTVDEIVEFITGMFAGKKIIILAPVVVGRKGEYLKLLDDFYRQGFSRARINGKIVSLSAKIKLARYKQHTIEIVVDELKIADRVRNDEMGEGYSKDFSMRLSEAVEQAVKLADGKVTIAPLSGTVVSIKDEITLSTKLACPKCGFAFSEITPRLFSFNSPYGACPACQGLGVFQEFDEGLVLPDKNKTIAAGAFLPWSYKQNNWWGNLLNYVCSEYSIDQHTPVKNLGRGDFELLLYGKGAGEIITVRHHSKQGPYYFNIRFNGILPLLKKRYHETTSDAVREDIEKYMSAQLCPDCQGRRLKKEALAVKIADKNIAEWTALTISEAKGQFENLELLEIEQKIAGRILKEIISRLGFLLSVGLNYLTLDRAAGTLSAGETQRIRLASQVGSGLVGVLYVLDEPSIGLHQRDNRRLLETLIKLRDLGNTVIVIEHDEETIRTADFIVDVGPGAGRHGGEIVAAGSLGKIVGEPRSITGQYLKGEKTIALPKNRRKLTGRYLTIKSASEHNLKNITVRFPLGMLVAVTGVSGSGKSTLVNDIVYQALANQLQGARFKPGKFGEIEGLEYLDKAVIVDQSPIGRTPRSNPATYTKAFDEIRQLFAGVPEARVRGYRPGRFSFNVPGGRCEKCLGDGVLKIEMHFLPDVYLPCDVCSGKRYNRETLEVKYKGKNISEVLEMTVEEALEFFGNIPAIKQKLQTLFDVGLGYIHLGQSATTLSGGEAQRVKLSAELARRATGKTLYILDEPTTGLHFDDVKKLLEVLNRLVEGGNTVVIIEHNLDVVKSADWLIDLGPEGGNEGGRVVTAGPPELVSGIAESYTGQFLKKMLYKSRS